MLYRYETHIHCSQCSACAVSTAQEMALALHRAGYAGMVLTDHFIFGNTAVDRTLPWEQRMQRYYQAFLDAKTAVQGLDFDVIFGIEHAYGDGKEVLIYGIELPFLLANPDISDITLDELVERVHREGGIVIQAHPYRDRSYVNMAVGPRADLVDGIEVYNAGNYPDENVQALALAGTRDYIRTSGGDIHRADDPRIGLAGIALPYRVRSSQAFAEALQRRDHQCVINGQILDHIQTEHLKQTEYGCRVARQPLFFSSTAIACQLSSVNIRKSMQIRPRNTVVSNFLL